MVAKVCGEGVDVCKQFCLETTQNMKVLIKEHFVKTGNAINQFAGSEVVDGEFTGQQVKINPHDVMEPRLRAT